MFNILYHTKCGRIQSLKNKKSALLMEDLRKNKKQRRKNKFFNLSKTQLWKLRSRVVKGLILSHPPNR